MERERRERVCVCVCKIQTSREWSLFTFHFLHHFSKITFELRWKKFLHCQQSIHLLLSLSLTLLHTHIHTLSLFLSHLHTLFFYHAHTHALSLFFLSVYPFLTIFSYFWIFFSYVLSTIFRFVYNSLYFRLMLTNYLSHFGWSILVCLNHSNILTKGENLFFQRVDFKVFNLPFDISLMKQNGF